MTRRRCCCVVPTVWTPWCQDDHDLDGEPYENLCRFRDHDNNDLIASECVLDLGSGGWVDGCDECDDIFKGEWNLLWGVSSFLPQLPTGPKACAWTYEWAGSHPTLGPVCGSTSGNSFVCIQTWIEAADIGGVLKWRWAAQAGINVLDYSPSAPYHGFSSASWRSAASAIEGGEDDCLWMAGGDNKVQMDKLAESHYKHYPYHAGIPCDQNGGLPDPIYLWMDWPD